MLFLRLLFMDYPKSDNDSHSPNRNDYVLKDNWKIMQMQALCIK